ncbi:MAG: phosphosulfolactate synthase [Chitinophagaceae bacterium]
MNFKIEKIPLRNTKPRTEGINMVMDKGMTLKEAECFIETAEVHVDFIKLGFGTSFITPNLDKKIKLYQYHNIPVYFGGTLFEAFVIRKQLKDYFKLLKKYNMEYVEISDGSMDMEQEEKYNLIKTFSKHFTVLSEVGSKEEGFQMLPFKWIELMSAEIEAGASYVITEARESGNVGIFRKTGKVREFLVEKILDSKIPIEKVIFEAPQKNQQLHFINKIGCNVNLGNIPIDEVIALEAMRIGLRGDTFNLYLE